MEKQRRDWFIEISRMSDDGWTPWKRYGRSRFATSENAGEKCVRLRKPSVRYRVKHVSGLFEHTTLEIYEDRVVAIRTADFGPEK